MQSFLRRALRAFQDTLGRNRLIQGLVARELSRLAAEPWSAAIIEDFIRGDHGAAYGVTERDRLELVRRFRDAAARIPSGTSPLIHTILAREILAIPPESRGDVIECGVWKGASTASLSLACGLVKRRLVVCDSFEGLPDDGLQRHVGAHTGIYGHYRQGMFAGSVEEVRENVRRCGNLDACTFLPGLFAESLKSLEGPLVFAFLDVDLARSTQDCLCWIWPLLVEDGFVYTDDAADLDVVRVFFDEAWWQEHLGCGAPGYVGSGCGLPLNPQWSTLGYTRKTSGFDPAKWKRAPFLYYPDDADATTQGSPATRNSTALPSADSSSSQGN